MYVQESKEEDEDEKKESSKEHKPEANQQKQPHSSAQPSQLRPEPVIHHAPPAAETDASQSAPSIARHHHHFPPTSDINHHPSSLAGGDALLPGADAFAAQGHNLGDMYQLAGGAAAAGRFGAGDVSLTLGLRHAGGGGSSSERSRFSVRDFNRPVN